MVLDDFTSAAFNHVFHFSGTETARSCLDKDTLALFVVFMTKGAGGIFLGFCSLLVCFLDCSL
ncbi:conserved hypothetical protein [Ricinus communis]|uniref:Uncharacterized protein n=1 Tax=Ricinus communis TaxID=3988 RepID=B9SFD2_RICCO|nr:conserved hypothetical protein [Ricinus communis]